MDNYYKDPNKVLSDHESNCVLHDVKCTQLIEKKHGKCEPSDDVDECICQN